MSKIAIIEDDTIISQMYRMKFEAAGYSVQVAYDGEQGLEMVRDFAPDIVLLDLQMPGKNGATTLAEIRANDWGKHVPVIILTNVSEEEAPRELRSLGIESYIVKAELTPSQVVERVKDVLDKLSH